jgi:hypothetical protein
MLYTHNTPVNREILQAIYIIFSDLPRQTEHWTDACTCDNNTGVS